MESEVSEGRGCLLCRRGAPPGDDLLRFGWVHDALLDHLRALAARAAQALGGHSVMQDDSTGFVSSEFDRFLNHVFAAGALTLQEAASALEHRPGFVWLGAAHTGVGPPTGPSPTVMHGMRAKIAQAARNWEMPQDIAQVRLGADLEDWHAVYREVFGADINSLGEWQRLYEALGPSGDNSLILHLARVDGAPAATAAVFLHDDIAGLYCFTTRRSMRGRGLASALIGASHSAASARGINRALLHATPSGRSVYAKAGYVDEKPLPVLIVP